MAKSAPIVLLILMAAGAALIWLRPGPGLVQPPSPSPSSPAPQARSTPPKNSGTAQHRSTLEPASQERAGNIPDQDPPFRFDEVRPLQEQLRVLLRSGCLLGKDILTACRERRDAVIADLVVILKDPSVGVNVQEKALGLLAFLDASSAVPAILEVARGDADGRTRSHAIGALNDFLPFVASADVRALFDGARTLEERFECVRVLGNLGDVSSLEFLEELARSYPDSLMLQFARDAADKVKVLNSTRRNVELVQLLHDEEHPLQEWALTRIVAGKDPAMAHHLREELEAHRRLPKNMINSTFEFDLLRGMRDLGQDLSPREKAFVDNFSVANDAPLPD